MIDQLFTEKFRPQKFEHMILPSRIENLLNKGISQNILLYGSPGLGKTSCAKVLVNDESITDLYINVSDESSVDIIRDKITKFCSEISVLGGKNSLKVVILDEMDGASDQFYKALRGTIEKFAKNCRFIGTCNYVNKIPDAIKSRFEMVNFDFVNKDEEEEVKVIWRDRISRIMKASGIEVSKDALNEFISRYFPDMRIVLNKIQGYQLSGITKLDSKAIKEQAWNFVDLYKLIFDNKDPVVNYKFVASNYASKIDDVMFDLGDDFISWIEENKKDKISCIPYIVIEVAKHQQQKTFVIDPLISLLSLVFTIQNIVNGK